MNDENNIAIDVDAEKQIFSSAITPSSIQSPSASVEQAEVNLPPSLPYTATQVNIKTNTQAEVSKIALDLSIKFNAEDSYNNLKTAVDSLQSQVNSNSNQLVNRWIPDPKAANKFEEKPTVDPTNLIFVSRREQFSRFPHWA
jgi:hypothetical protein